MSARHVIPASGKVADESFQSLEVGAPVASIIIPFHNCRELTEACLRSVAEHSEGVQYEILLFDDASTELPDLELLPNRDRIRVFRTVERSSYATLNNAGCDVARGEFLVLLNNDTLVTPGWLNALIAAARREENLGVLGNKHLDPRTGRLQHAGMAFDDQDHPWHIAPGTDPDAPAVNVRRELQCVTFACALIPKAVYWNLRGLDEDFRHGFEDVDFCLNARAAGLRVVYDPGSVIYHYGQQTPGRMDAEAENWKLFQSVWGGKVERDLRRLTEEYTAANERNASRPRLRARPEPGLHLAVDLSDANAFTWATADLALALVRRGVPLSLTPSRPHTSIEGHKRELLSDLMRAPTRGSFHLKWSHFWPKHLKQPLHGDVNAEFFCTNYRQRADGAANDLWMRHVRLNGNKKLAVSDFNREALLEVGVPAADIAVVPLGYAPEIDTLFPATVPLVPRSRRELHILLLTNSHDLHRYGTDLAVRALAAAFGPHDPVIVHIRDYGRPHGRDPLREVISAQPRFPRVVWHRKFLSKAALLQLHADCDVQLAPFRGEGFAMKICDAMALGLPTLMPAFGGPLAYATPGSFIPLPHDEVPATGGADHDNYFIGRTSYWCEARVDEMTAILRGLPSRREELARIGAQARAHVRGHFTWDESARKLMDALEGWGARAQMELAVRRQPDTVPISVVIPTKDRTAVLDLTLAAYARQTVPARDYELVLVNDGGAREPVEQLIRKHQGAVPLRVVHNAGPGGCGQARNVGHATARGHIIVMSGDDIVPEPGFIAAHRAAHARHPELETAFVGRTLWHASLPVTPFMAQITGRGGDQFDQGGMVHDRPVLFDRMYSSNCSIKRDFLANLPEHYSPHFTRYGYEDIELAWRLHLRGMVLRHDAHAVAGHLHPVTPATFAPRQRSAGRMMTVLALMHPAFVPNQHTAFLHALEFAAARTDRDTIAWSSLARQAEEHLASLVRSCESLFEQSGQLRAGDLRPVSADAHNEWNDWLERGGIEAWKSASELAFRIGMAEEWAQRCEDRDLAIGWTWLVTLPRISGHGPLHGKMPRSVPDFGPFLVRGSDTPWRTLKFIRELPALAPGIAALERSRPGKNLRELAARIIRRA